MVYVPKYKEIAESLIIDNVLAIIKRDLKPALDTMYPTEAALASTSPAFLPDLQNRTFGSFLRLGFPALVADLVDGEEEESGGGSHVDEELRIEILLVVTDPDGANVTRRLAKYVRALRSILKTAARADYLTGIDQNYIMGFTLKLSRKYLPIGKGTDQSTQDIGYMRPATFVLTLNFSER